MVRSPDLYSYGPHPMTCACVERFCIQPPTFPYHFQSLFYNSP